MQQISCSLMGGLGNQLFQLFTTISYGIRTKRKFVFPYSEKLVIGTIRPTYWDNFLSSLKIFTTFNNKVITNWDLQQFNIVKEPDFSYSEIPFFDNNHIMFSGYFQSYKYFEYHKNTLFSIIKLNYQKQNIIQSYNDLLTDDCVNISMHFRLGDYKNIQDFHPLMTLEYYRNSLLHIIGNVHLSNNLLPIRIIYFCQTEDNDTVNDMICSLQNEFNNVAFIKADDNIDDWKQMLIMSCCNHNIIANSTFSWWGAYFNNNENKIVCHPNKWFGIKLNHNTSDLFPIDWIKIDV